MSDKCGDCKFWKAISDGVGICRGAPPTVISDPDAGVVTAWPETHRDEPACAVFVYEPSDDSSDLTPSLDSVEREYAANPGDVTVDDSGDEWVCEWRGGPVARTSTDLFAMYPDFEQRLPWPIEWIAENRDKRWHYFRRKA